MDHAAPLLNQCTNHSQTTSSAASRCSDALLAHTHHGLSEGTSYDSAAHTTQHNRTNYRPPPHLSSAASSSSSLVCCSPPPPDPHERTHKHTPSSAFSPPPPHKHTPVHVDRTSCDSTHKTAQEPHQLPATPPELSSLILLVTGMLLAAPARPRRPCHWCWRLAVRQQH